MTEERGSGEAGAAEAGGREAAEAGGREAAEAWRRFGERDLRYAFASTTEALTHDLKNLVGAALMSLRACASRRAPGGPDEGGEFFDDALRTLEQGAKTLDRMRRLLEGPAGGPCLVADAARGAAALLGPALPPSVALRVEVAPGQSAPLDGEALTHVFFHLFARAAAAVARAGRPGTVVVASAPAPEGWPEGSSAFVVRDDGAPLRGEALPFDPFDPFDPAAPPGLERVRIGLAMVKYLVESGGGEVQFERHGDETVFRCNFPRPGPDLPLRMTRA